MTVTVGYSSRITSIKLWHELRWSVKPGPTLLVFFAMMSQIADPAIRAVLELLRRSSPCHDFSLVMKRRSFALTNSDAGFSLQYTFGR